MRTSKFISLVHEWYFLPWQAVTNPMCWRGQKLGLWSILCWWRPSHPLNSTSSHDPACSEGSPHRLSSPHTNKPSSPCILHFIHLLSAPPPPSADVLEWLVTLTLWQMYQCYEFLQEPGFTDYLISFLSLRSLPTLRLLVLFAALWISYSNVFHVRCSILTVLVTVPLTLHFLTLLCLLFSHQHTIHWFLFPSQSDFCELKLAKQPRNPSIKGHLSILVFFFFFFALRVNFHVIISI